MTDTLAPSAGRWFRPEYTDPDTPIRLFLFHCAGGAASMYRSWPEVLPDDVAHQCIQLPGRQERITEPAFSDIEPLVEAVHDQLRMENDERPYAFFGHSMGALVAYRVAVRMERAGDVGPALFGAAAWTPQSFSNVTKGQAYLSEPQALEWIQRLGAVPPKLYEDPALLARALPAIRSDVSACASYVDDGATLRCPIVTYSATADPLVPAGAMAAWRTRTEDYLGNREFPGGHFFINDHRLAIATDFIRLLRRLAAGW